MIHKLSALACGAQLRESFADLDFQAARHRRIQLGADQLVRHEPLAGRERVGFIVLVAIAGAVAEILHQLRRRVADVHRHLEAAGLFDERTRSVVAGVDGIALRCAGQIDDGDRKRDEDKKIGATGGVYYCKARNIEELIATMDLTIKRGQGGDAPENVIEGLIFGINKSGKVDDVILIADNWAKVRDIKMLPRIKVPVHVVLCGVYEGMEINEDYLNIAYKTRGSVHTIEQDITDLMNQTAGKKFNINGVDYIIKNGSIKAY